MDSLQIWVLGMVGVGIRVKGILDIPGGDCESHPLFYFRTLLHLKLNLLLIQNLVCKVINT